MSLSHRSASPDNSGHEVTILERSTVATFIAIYTAVPVPEQPWTAFEPASRVCANTVLEKYVTWFVLPAMHQAKDN